MAQIILIAAMAQNRVIGRNNQLIWHISTDLKHFKKHTTGQVIIMGRKTFESLGRPLPNRTNVVITRSTDFRAEGVMVFHSLTEALTAFSHLERIYIAGGAEIYRQALPMADQMELTIIHREYDGDATFPEWNEEQWEMIQSTSVTDTDGNLPVQLTFKTLTRKRR